MTGDTKNIDGDSRGFLRGCRGFERGVDLEGEF